MKHSSKLLKIFVYGTLKQGFPNHDAYCQRALSIEPAHVRGRLHLHSSGFPVLAIPPEDVLAEGSASPMADMRTQGRYAARYSHSDEALKRFRPYGTWTLVSGELMTFDDPQSRLPALDDLEDYTPQEPTLYRRVLALCMPARGTPVPAWAYVLGTADGELMPLGESVWTFPLP